MNKCGKSQPRQAQFPAGTWSAEPIKHGMRLHALRLYVFNVHRTNNTLTPHRMPFRGLNPTLTDAPVLRDIHHKYRLTTKRCVPIGITIFVVKS